MDRYQLAKAFERRVMEDRIKKIDDIQGLREVCIALMDANFRLQDLKANWKNNGWL